MILLVGLEAAIVIESLRWTRKGYYQGPIKHPLLRPLLQPLLSVDLSGAVLSGGDRLPDLGGARLEGARLLRVTARGLNFRMARLETAVLSFSDLSGSNFERADLIEANFHHGRAPGADFSRAVLIGTVAIGSDFRDASFRGARLDYARFNAVDARGSDWTDADFYGFAGQIVGSSLRGAVFRNANLTNLLLMKDDFTDADLAGASLRGAKLWRTVFKGANLEGADLRGTDGEADQLGEAATLYNARLDPPLAEALMRDNPRLFERPAQAPTLRPTGSAGSSDGGDD